MCLFFNTGCRNRGGVIWAAGLIVKCGRQVWHTRVCLRAAWARNSLPGPEACVAAASTCVWKHHRQLCDTPGLQKNPQLAGLFGLLLTWLTRYPSCWHRFECVYRHMRASVCLSVLCLHIIPVMCSMPRYSTLKKTNLIAQFASFCPQLAACWHVVFGFKTWFFF